MKFSCIKTCKYPKCTKHIPLNKKTKYCDNHVCAFNKCKDKRLSNSLLCEIHKCKLENCQRISFVGGYCYVCCLNH